MTFVNGQVIDESDFVATAVAGQDIAINDALMIGNGTDTGSVLLEVTSSDNGNQVCSATTWVAQKVRFPAVRNITDIGFKHVHTSGIGYTVRIRSSLTGADLATGTVSPGVSNGSITIRLATLSAPVNLSANTDYYVIFSGVYTVYGQTTSSYSGGEAYVSTTSGTSWSTHGTIADFGVMCVGGITESGKLYKAVVSLPDLFVGFALAAASLDANCTLNPQFMLSGFSGLSPGLLYLSAATPGALATTGTYKVAVAVSATKIVRTFMTS